MKTVQDSIEINAPVHQAFEALADPAQQMKFDGDMMLSCEKISDGPIGKGTRFRGRFKGMGTMEYSYSEFIPDQLIEHAVQMPFGSLRHRFQFEANGGGTRLTQQATLQPNFAGKIMWPLMMKNMLSKRLQTLNVLVKGFAEAKK